MERKIFKTEIGGREVSVEIGAYCGQANGSCLIRCGETVVLTNATMAKHPVTESTFSLSVLTSKKNVRSGQNPRRLQKERRQTFR